MIIKAFSLDTIGLPSLTGLTLGLSVGAVKALSWTAAEAAVSTVKQYEGLTACAATDGDYRYVIVIGETISADTLGTFTVNASTGNMSNARTATLGEIGGGENPATASYIALLERAINALDGVELVQNVLPDLRLEGHEALADAVKRIDDLLRESLVIKADNAVLKTENERLLGVIAARDATIVQLEDRIIELEKEKEGPGTGPVDPGTPVAVKGEGEYVIVAALLGFVVGRL